MGRLLPRCGGFDIRFVSPRVIRRSAFAKEQPEEVLYIFASEDCFLYRREMIAQTNSIDPIRALSTRRYLGLTVSIYWRLLRKKLPKHFRCDCGAAHVWSMFEYERWHQIHTFACHDCGDIYKTLGNTIVTIIPNPLNRCLVADKARDGISGDHPYSVIVRQRHSLQKKADLANDSVPVSMLETDQFRAFSVLMESEPKL